MEAAPSQPQSNGGAAAGRPDELSLGNLTVDSGVFLVRIANRPVELSYYEFELMRVLAAQPDRIIPYDGITSSLLSNVAVRSGEILASVLTNTPVPVLATA